MTKFDIKYKVAVVFLDYVFLTFPDKQNGKWKILIYKTWEPYLLYTTDILNRVLRKFRKWLSQIF